MEETPIVTANIAVLIVDNDLENRRVLNTFFKKMKFREIVEVDNGQEAIISLANHHIGLVVMELELPVMNGIQLTRHIRKLARYKDIPILALSKVETKEMIIQSLQAGIDAYLKKPPMIDEIYPKIQEAFTRRKQKQTSK